jgi:uncharacterized membrane protein (UPF0127 family)
LVFACERRVGEPVATSAERSTSRSSAQPAPASNPEPLPPRAPKLPLKLGDAPADSERCVRPSPVEPTRPAVSGVDPKCPQDRHGPLALARGRVIFEPEGVAIDVEVADDKRTRERGLMYRTSLGEKEGMLFVFEDRFVHRFWMKNTCIPLDMLFIDQDGLIVGIEENVPTLNLNTYFVDCPSLFVLEVNAGWSRRHGVRAGQRIKIEGV